MTNITKKNYLFLGFAIPNDEMEKVFNLDNCPQIQTHNFNWNLIKGMELSSELDFTYISSRPVTDYPLFPEKKIRRRKWNVKINGKLLEIQEIPFLNTGILKIITRFLSTLYYSFKRFAFKADKGGVIVYSVHIPYMLVGFIISRIYKIDYIAIWTDPPSVRTDKESKLKSKLRNIELKVSKYLMKKATKVVALTKYLAEDFAPGKPYIVIEGIVDTNEQIIEEFPINTLPSSFIKIVYTGSLEKRYGVKNIVEGFLLVKNRNVILEVYGRGDYEEELKQISEQNSNVIYKGFVANKEILTIQREADFLINARSSKANFVKYSFPSKTLEYMLSGTPLITTMLPGIPEEYRKYVIVLKDNETETIRKEIENLLEMTSEDKINIGIEAKKFVAQKDCKCQGDKIIKFITN